MENDLGKAVEHEDIDTTAGNATIEDLPDEILAQYPATELGDASVAGQSLGAAL